MQHSVGTGSSATMVPDNTGHESSPGTRVVRGLLWGLYKPTEFLDNPEERKECSEGVILKFMPIKKIRFKPVLIELRNIKQNNSACDPSVIQYIILHHYFLAIPPKDVK